MEPKNNTGASPSFQVCHKHELLPLLLLRLTFRLFEDVGEPALAAVLAIVVCRHKDSSAAFLGRALAAETVDFPIVVHLIILELSKMHCLVLVADLLGGGVVLLLPLLGPSSQPEHEMESRLFLNVVVGQSPAILQLFAPTATASETDVTWTREAE